MISKKDIRITDYGSDDNPCCVRLQFDCNYDKLGIQVADGERVNLYMVINPFAGFVTVEYGPDGDGRSEMHEYRLSSEEEKRVFLDAADEYATECAGTTLVDICNRYIQNYMDSLPRNDVSVKFFSDEFMQKCNRTFGVDTAEIDFLFIFDVYDSREELEKSLGEDYEELAEEGTAEVIDGLYVFFNETYADDYYVGCSFDRVLC